MKLGFLHFGKSRLTMFKNRVLRQKFGCLYFRWQTERQGFELNDDRRSLILTCPKFLCGCSFDLLFLFLCHICRGYISCIYGGIFSYILFTRHKYIRSLTQLLLLDQMPEYYSFCVFLFNIYLFSQYINIISINHKLMCLILPH